MTDIASYLNLLFATTGEAHCPRTAEPTPNRSRRARSSRRSSRCRKAPRSSCARRCSSIYGEDLEVVFTEVRKKGCRRTIIDGKAVDIAENVEMGRGRCAPPGRRRRSLRRRPEAREGDQAGIASTLLVGDGLMQVDVGKGAGKAETARFYEGCPAGRITSSTATSARSTLFNNPESACRKCGRARRRQADAPGAAHPRSQAKHPGGVVREVFKYNRTPWDGRMMFSLAAAARLRARLAVEAVAGKGAPRHPLRDRPEENRPDVAAGREGQARQLGGQGDPLRRASPAGSSGITAAIVSAARPIRGWRRGSTR